MIEHDSEQKPPHSVTEPPGFNAFEAWKQYQAVAMHFNDLLMRLRSQSLAAVAAFAALAGVVLKSDLSSNLRWGTMASVFTLLLLFWVAIWILDFAYYNRLLIGAVDALLEIENDTKVSNRVQALILSTKIEAAVADWNSPRTGRLGREKAKWCFYIFVFVALSGGLVVSLYAAGGPMAMFHSVVDVPSTTPANQPLQPTAPK